MLQNNIFLAVIVVAFAMLGGKLVYFKILNIAQTKEITDVPNDRKLQRTPIPVMGGIVVYFGIVVGLLAGGVSVTLPSLLTCGVADVPLSGIAPVIFCMCIMLYLGSIDDVIGLSSGVRFLLEAVMILVLIFTTGVCVDSLHGLWGIESINWLIAVPLTIFAGLGIINSLNMIDGVNGLSSGLLIFCSSFYGIVFMQTYDIANASLSFAVAGSLIVFFVHNVFGLRSRMFIGDAGTMMLGLAMVWLTANVLSDKMPIELLAGRGNLGYVAMVVALFVVPVADTLRVMTMRMLHKKSPFNPDKTHLHHVFVRIGFSHSFTALLEIIIDMFTVLVWYICYRTGASVEMQLYVVVLAGAMLVWGTYAFLDYQIEFRTDLLHKLVYISIWTHLGRTEWWKTLTDWLDKEEVSLYKEYSKERLKRRYGHAHTDNPDCGKENRNLVVGFMNGKIEVYVEDIVMNSGADKDSVVPILTEEIQAGNVSVVRKSPSGTAEIVCLAEKRQAHVR